MAIGSSSFGCSNGFESLDLFAFGELSGTIFADGVGSRIGGMADVGGAPIDRCLIFVIGTSTEKNSYYTAFAEENLDGLVDNKWGPVGPKTFYSRFIYPH